MYTSKIEVRVRYGETDQMGYCYYGNYAEYFEVARVETLRELGLPYKNLEEQGILLPVLELKIKYLKPAYYDDLLTIKTCIKEIPGVRIIFEYETFNEQGEKLNIGDTTLVFLNKDTNKPMAAPKKLIQKLEEHINS